MARSAQTLNSAAPAQRGNGELTQQAIKSAQTRERLVEATIRCLVKFGYANTTTLRVAAEAGLSRGAMMHHFENGAALMQATVTELHEKRLRAFRRGVSAMHNDVRALVRNYWKQMSSPTFVAFHELAVAARTDSSLAKILIPAQEEYRTRWYQLAVELFPEWQRDRARFDLALSLSQNTLEGMAINRLTHGLDETMTEPMLENLEKQIRALKPEAQEE
jgi:AcrR family transcriptional regulator